jgi:hypothetical protein
VTKKKVANVDSQFVIAFSLSSIVLMPILAPTFRSLSTGLIRSFSAAAMAASKVTKYCYF